MEQQYIQKAYGGCDVFELATCPECCRKYYKKTNHLFGKGAFAKQKKLGYLDCVSLKEECECDMLEPHPFDVEDCCNY